MSIQRELINIYISGELFQVPEGSTIISAMEYAGFQLKRGVGCREGYCGACATVYRETGDYKLKGGLACQTVVTDGMAVAMIPFVPAEKPTYNLEDLEADVSTFTKLFPTVFRCVSCNTCTKACPQEIQVMDYVQAIIRGDIKRAANLSFDCIRCGLCALRCPAEIVQYNNAILARRLYAKYLAPKSPELDARLKELDEKKYDKELEGLKKMPKDKLSEKYYSREIKIS